MEYRRLGSAGLQVSALSFGSWVTFGDQIGEDAAHDMMQAAIDAGVNFFDNAEAYAGGKSETMMGKVVKKAGWKRSDLVISTKIFWGGDGPNDSDDDCECGDGDGENDGDDDDDDGGCGDDDDDRGDSDGCDCKKQWWL